MKHRFPVVFLLAFALLLIGAAPVLAQGGPVRGAIFTTLHDGSAVNAN